jgi:hypothetical protein
MITFDAMPNPNQMTRSGAIALQGHDIGIEGVHQNSGFGQREADDQPQPSADQDSEQRFLERHVCAVGKLTVAADIGEDGADLGEFGQHIVGEAEVGRQKFPRGHEDHQKERGIQVSLHQARGGTRSGSGSITHGHSWPVSLKYVLMRPA